MLKFAGHLHCTFYYFFCYKKHIKANKNIKFVLIKRLILSSNIKKKLLLNVISLPRYPVSQLIKLCEQDIS